MRYRHGIIMRMVLCLFAFMPAVSAEAQKSKGNDGGKVYLEHADVLLADQFAKPDIQVVRGKVRFRYNDTQLTCDSAYFNQIRNTFQAFGHVHMRKSGGVNLTCGRAFYDGNAELVQARVNVVLTQPGRTLYCDSLDYNTGTEYANYFGGKGGRLKTENTTVESLRGEYYLDTHEANFYDNVVMRSPKYTINTDNLNYNTETEIAHVTGPSVIRGRNGEVIHTSDGYYYSKYERMELTGRSTITSKERDVEGDNLKYNSETGESEGHGNVRYLDKIGNRVVTGDNLFYNEKTRVGEGTGNVVYIDNKSQNSLTAGYVHYTDSSAVAYGNPVVKDFSQGDTLFVHSDTIMMKAYHLETDSVYRKVYCYDNVRAYRTDVQAVCGLLISNSRDSCMTMYYDPIVWTGNRQLLGDSIKAYMNDSTVREAYVFGQALAIEQMDDGKHYNQISSKEMRAFFTDGQLRRNEAIGNVLSVYYILEEKDSSILYLNYMECDTMRMYVSAERQMEKIWGSKPDAMMYPLTQVPPGKDRLPGFAWYDYVRPVDKNDIFRRAGKGDGGKQSPQEPVMPPGRGTGDSGAGGREGL